MESLTDKLLKGVLDMANIEIDFAEYHVLVVSNAPKKYRLVMRQISNAGMTASAMSSIKKALTYVVAKKPTHLFMSANMPKMNAVKVAKLLSTTFNIPVIIYPEDFGYKTTKFLKDCGWPNVMTSTLSGASVMNMLRTMALRDQQAAEGITPDNSPVDEPSSDPMADEESESLYSKKARRSSQSDEIGDENLYARKKKPKGMSQEEEQEYYAEQARRKRPEFFDSDEEASYSKKKKARTSSSDDEYYDDSFEGEWDEEYDDDYDEENSDALSAKARKSRPSSGKRSSEEDLDIYEAEQTRRKKATKSQKSSSSEYDDDYEMDDEFEEVDYDSLEDENYDYEEYDEDYEDENGELRSRKVKRRRKKRRGSKEALAEDFEEDHYEGDDDFFIDDEDEEDDDLDLASLMKNALSQKSQQDKEEDLHNSAKAKRQSNAAEDFYEEDEETDAHQNKKKAKSKLSKGSTDEDFEYDEDESSDLRRTKRRKSKSGAKADFEDSHDEESESSDDFAEYRRKKKSSKRKSRQAKDSELAADQDDLYDDENYEDEDFDYDDDSVDQDFNEASASTKRKRRRKKTKRAKNSEGELSDEDDEYDDLIRKSKDPDSLEESFDEDQILEPSAYKAKKEDESGPQEGKARKSYNIESAVAGDQKARSSSQSLEEMLDPSKSGDTSDWDELSKEERRERDLKTFEGAIANAIESLSTEGDPMRVDTSATRSLVIFAASSENFSGYLALAAGKDNIVSTELSGPFRKRLLQALRKEGLYLELLDPFYIVTDTMSYTAMMKKTALITYITAHMGEEVGVSFLEVEPSFFEAKYTKSEDQDMYRVNIDSITANQPVRFSYYLQLKHNNKFIKYVPQGGSFDEEQLARLKKHKVESLCIENNNLRKWRETTASNFFNSQLKKKAN